MPAETTTMIAYAAAAAAAFFFAGATATPDQKLAADDAVKAAQVIVQMSEERVLLISLGGGIMGAFVSWGFGFFRGDGQQQAKRMAASAFTAPIMAPYYMLWQEIPQTTIPTIFISGAVGLLAHIAVPLLAEFVPKWMSATSAKFLPKEDKDK